MTVDLSNVPSCVFLAVGERLVIPLPSYANSGHYWSINCSGGTDVAQVQVELQGSQVEPPLAGDGTGEPPELFTVPEVVVLEGITPGALNCQLVLSRSFGSEGPATSHELRITVADR